MIEMPNTIDVIQETEGNLDIPQIRVWCHPLKIGRNGSDYYEIFDGFKDALSFIKDNEVLAEPIPLIAFKGWELDIFGIKGYNNKEWIGKTSSPEPKSKIADVEYRIKDKAEITIKESVGKLASALKKDNGLYYAYQANIAMAFKDEYRRNTKKYKNLQDIHMIANTAAKNFLNLWIK